MKIRMVGVAALALSVLSTLLMAPPASARTPSVRVIDPQSYTCAEPGYLTFEDLPDKSDLSTSTIKGVQFTTTDGNAWKVGDFAEGAYNGKYPNGSYTSQGSHWAWLGPEQSAGRITFANGLASVFSLLVGVGSTPVVLDGYAADGTLLETAGPADVNIDTGRLAELKIDRETDDLAYVVVHGSGNYFLVDGICTDAPGVPRTAMAYVALGDSYSAGEGVKPFFEKSDDCHRSKKAYSTRITVPYTDDVWYAKRNTEGFAWGFLACSGATSTEILKKQVTKPKKGENKNFVKLGKSTRLVTLTAGGNDANFVDILTFCATDHASCQDDPYKDKLPLDRWLDMRLSTVQADLVKLYRAIRSKAPTAKVIVLGYPRLFPASVDEQNCVRLRQFSYTTKKGKKKTRHTLLFSHAEQNFLRSAGDKMDATIEAAVAEAKVGAVFVPMAGVFDGHEPCGHDGEWVNGIALKPNPKNPVADKSFHPNATGQATYGQMINSVLTIPPIADGHVLQKGSRALVR